jgi:hypothetical protein
MWLLDPRERPTESRKRNLRSGRSGRSRLIDEGVAAHCRGGLEQFYDLLLLIYGNERNHRVAFVELGSYSVLLCKGFDSVD